MHIPTSSLAPSPRMSCENCREVSCQHMCNMALALKGLALAEKCLFYTGFPQARGAEFYPFGSRFGLSLR